MPALNKTNPPSVPPSTDVGLKYNKDGSASLSDGKTVSAVEVKSFFQQAAKQDVILYLGMPVDGAGEIRQSVVTLLTGVQNDDKRAVVGVMSPLLKGVHDFCGLGMPNMTAPDKTPKADGLVQAGYSAVNVLNDFPNPAYNARVRVDPPTLHERSFSLDLHYSMQSTYAAASSRVNIGAGYLANLVYGDANLTKKAIADALPLDENLQHTAADMVDYFADTVAKGQQTKNVLKKTREQVTQQVTKDVQDQALQQARQEVSAQVQNKGQTMLNSLNSSNNT